MLTSNWISVSFADPIKNNPPSNCQHCDQPSTMSRHSRIYCPISRACESRHERARSPEPPTYGSYFWRVASDSDDSYRRVRNWSQDCKCHCCPHNPSEPSPYSTRRDYSQHGRTYSYSSGTSSSERRRDRDSYTPLLPTPILKRDNYRYDSSLRSSSYSPSRIRLYVTDNMHCELGRHHGQEFSISVLPRATAEDIMDALIPNPSRHRIIVHWRSSSKSSNGTGSEELTDKLPLWEISQYARHLELRRCSRQGEKKRVHWAI